MFICLCETFLHEGIPDSEIQIPGFIIVRSDIVFLKYSNSVCDLLIVKILSLYLIIILVYIPSFSPLSDFDDYYY